MRIKFSVSLSIDRAQPRDDYREVDMPGTSAEQSYAELDEGTPSLRLGFQAN